MTESKRRKRRRKKKANEQDQDELDGKLIKAKESSERLQEKTISISLKTKHHQEPLGQEGMLSHNSSQNQIIPNYYSSSEAMQGVIPHYVASQEQPINCSNSGNNNMSYNFNNSKPVSKISAPQHGKHNSLYEKNPGQGQQNQAIIRLPSIGQLSSTKALAINPISPNDCGSLFDTENRFINSCSSAQQKKRMIRVQSKNKFPSDFFNENFESTNQMMDDNSQSNNAKFFQSPENTFKNTPSQSRLSNPQIQVNNLKLSQHSLENQQSVKKFEIYTQDYNINAIPLSPKSILEDKQREFIQIHSPQNTQLIQRPFISAMGSRSTKSPTISTQQQNTPLNQLKRDFQFSKNNFIEQQYEVSLTPQQQQLQSQNTNNNNNNNQSVKTLGQKQLLTRANLSSSGSVKRLISAQIPSAVVSPCNTFRMLSPTEKQSRLVSPSSAQSNQKIQNRLQFKSSVSMQPEIEKEDNSIQEINIQEIRSCTKELSIPNSPKNAMNSSVNDSVQKSTNKNTTNLKQKQELATPKCATNQKNLQHPPMSHQAQRPKATAANNHKRTPNYDVKSSANMHEAINKGSFTCKSSTNDKKDKLFQGQQKERKDTENSENQESATTKFISRKPVVVNKAKGGNIDFTNFKMPLSTMNRKIKDIPSLPTAQQDRNSGKSATVIMPSTSKSKLENSTKAVASAASSQTNIENQKKRKARALSQTKLQSFTPLPEQTPKSLIEVQIEEQIEDQHSFNGENVKEEQTYEGENSDTTKNSIQQNNTISLNSPSIQHDNPYLFSDKNIQSTQNSMLALPPPQLKQFYSECCETSNFTQVNSPSLNYQNTFSIPIQMSIRSEENIFALDQSHKQCYQQQNFSQNSSNQYNQVTEFIQDQQDFEVNCDLSHTNNNYNRTANFTPCHNASSDAQSSNTAQKLKSSQKALPKIALNFKENEKYKPFLIRKVSSQSSMRVKGNLNNYSSNSSSSSQSNNIVFDFNKNGSASTTHGKSMISTPTLLASNEYINSHEFSFSNQ